MKRYVKLFEDFTNSKEATPVQNTSISWSDVREALQNRLPFAIICFKKSEDLEKSKLSDLNSSDYVRQSFFSIVNGEKHTYPSVFVLKADNFKNKVKDFYNKYDIKHIVVGEMNDERPTMYFEDGTSAELGNEIVSALDSNEMAADDHYQVKSQYYKFIDA